MRPRGFCGIGIVGGKSPVNVGTLWRSSAILGADFTFTAGARYPKQASDTLKAWRHLPHFQIAIDELRRFVPKDCVPVAVEFGVDARPLERYVHPERAIYLLGAEDTGLPVRVVEWARDVVQIPGPYCLNVAVAGSLILYDRRAKQPS